MLATSYDGVKWFTQNNDKPVFPDNTTNVAVTYSLSYNIFLAVIARDENENRGIYYSFSDDGIRWSPSSFDDANKVIVGQGRRPTIHNAGFRTDTQGLVSGSNIDIYYGAGDAPTCPNDPRCWKSWTWDIDKTSITLIAP
jgi:hypothetical protein